LPLRPPAFAEPGTAGEVASQAVLFPQVLGFFKALTASRPLVVLLDDLHWADPASLDLLRFLAHAIATVPMLILVTYRDDELSG
jgi:predicted ATPase